MFNFDVPNVVSNMKIVVFTGSGISQESGIATFRDSNGLWKNYNIEDICTSEALKRDRMKVIDFYNMRRKEVLSKEPNKAHLALVKLEDYHDVEIITQNIDDLHERAGSTKVTHIHGEIRKLRSSIDELATVPIEGWEQQYDALHHDGSLLRPFVVLFDENVPMYSIAQQILNRADIVVVIGTSLQVTPAKYLINELSHNIPIHVVDPNIPKIEGVNRSCVRYITKLATVGVPELVNELIKA